MSQEKSDNDSQKRKRPAANEQPTTPQTEAISQKHQHQAPNGPPNLTPPSNITPPNYTIRQFNKPNSPLPPPSPSNEAAKRRKVLSQNRQNKHTEPTAPVQEQNMEMAVDEESIRAMETHETIDQGNRDRGQDKTPTRQSTYPKPAASKEGNMSQEDDIYIEVDEIENAKTMARILNIDSPSTENDHFLPPPHPHDKFTKGPMPEICDEDPATLLAGIERTQLQSWLDLPTGKVLARPFDIEVKYKLNHSNIAMKLRTAVKEITGAPKVTVAQPKRDPNLPRDGPLKHPITFLIHDISKKDVETLLERTVWSAKEITFQVSEINVKRPNFIFTMEGIATDSTELVLASIGETWNDQETNNFIHKLASAAPNKEEQQNRLNEIIEFLESATVRHLDVRNEGGQENPHYNIYADGEIIQNNTTWLELRKFLRGRIYKSNFHGDGKTTATNFICSLCHGHDHPRGLCAFPHIQGWNGGARNPKRPPFTEQYDTPNFGESHHSVTQESTGGRGPFQGRFPGSRRGRGRGNPPSRYPPY